MILLIKQIDLKVFLKTQVNDVNNNSSNNNNNNINNHFNSTN